jgi:hypothetical protein
MRGHERVDELLYDGETVRESVELDGARVVVTSHRLLAFTPGMDGANFQQADLPNVEGVDTGARGPGTLLERGLRVGTVGAVLVGTGLVVDFDSLVGGVDLGTGAGRTGIGGMLGPVRRLLGLVRDLDQYMQLLGALVLLLSVALLSAYWYLREPTLTVEVAGGEDLHVPRGADGTAARLEGALAPGPAVPGGDPEEAGSESAGEWNWSGSGDGSDGPSWEP